MGKIKYETKYNGEWENAELYPDLADWIMPAKTGQADDIHHYQCKICKTGRLKLPNMGVTAPRSHLKDGKDKNGDTKLCKHNINMRLYKKTKKDCFSSYRNGSAASSSNSPKPLETGVEAPSVQSTSAQPSSSIIMYLNNATPEVLKSWILWCFDVVHGHRSLRSSGGQGDLFRAMFPDSCIAEKFGTLSAAKISYIINHGLAPYFKKCIMS